MYIYEKNRLKMTSFEVVFNAGALYEKEGRYGTMHLMEHLMCKQFKDMVARFTKLGITWNAYTGNEQVVFWLRGLDKYLTPEIKKEYVSKLLSAPTFGQDEFDNEKRTVLQEYGDCFSDMEGGTYLNFMRKHYNMYNAIGRRSDIENFTYEDYLEVKEEFFMHPARIVEIGPRKTDIQGVDYETERHPYANPVFSVNPYDVVEEPYAESDEKTLVMAVCKTPVSRRDYKYVTVALSVLNDGLESPLYQEIREKRGLSYYSSASKSTMIDHADVMFSACTTTENVNKLVDVYCDVFSDIGKFMPEDRFNDIIDKMKISLEKSKLFRYESHNDLTAWDNICMSKSLKGITYEKVLKAARKYFCSKNMVIYWGDHWKVVKK